MAESRVQITSVVSGFAHKSCTDSGIAANTSCSRATVQRTPNCFTAHISKLEKRKQCVLYAILFSAVGGAMSVFELSRADIFFPINSSHESRGDCDCGNDTRRCNSLRLEAASAHCMKSRRYCLRRDSHHNFSS